MSSDKIKNSFLICAKLVEISFYFFDEWIIENESSDYIENIIAIR